MSDTPRTDSRVFRILSELQSGTREVVDASVARDLERELNARAKPEQSPSGEGVWVPQAVLMELIYEVHSQSGTHSEYQDWERANDILDALSASSQKVHVTPEK